MTTATMANGAAKPGLAFPRQTFAQLTPAPFLQAHLKQPSSVRPNGRKPHEFRHPVVNNNSLSHSNGSSLVRFGDTAIVCGVRAEVLLASDIPRPPPEDIEEEDLVEDLGLIVPNVELSTGCSSAHLPGNPPGSLAQALSYRIHSLIHSSNLIHPSDLRILFAEPSIGDDGETSVRTVTKAYWVLYIDILCIALDGNAFDAAWVAVLSALQNTLLPKAWWDSDRESILASPKAAEAAKLGVQSVPVASTFVVFDTHTPLKPKEDAHHWILADPDSFEEGVCNEVLTIVVTSDRNKQSLSRIENYGGACIDTNNLGDCVRLAEERCHQIRAMLAQV